MTNQIVPFQFENSQIRVVNNAAGEPLFVAKDILASLGYAVDNVTNRISHVPEEWRGSSLITTTEGVRKLSVLTEQGLYFFLGRSDKPKTLPFQKWLAGEVVPSIRKTGSYHAPRPVEIPLIELQERKVALAERVLSIARQVGDDVLEVMAVDSIKNALVQALPSPESVGMFQTHEVLEALGMSAKQIRSSVSNAGKILRAAFVAQMGEEPKEVARIIDGAKRLVKTYPMSWFPTAKALLSEHFDVEVA